MDKSQALLQKAVRQHQAGQHAEAERLCRKLLTSSPGNLQARFLLATMRAQRGDLAAAIRDFHEIIRLRPDMAAAHLNLGTALSSIGRHQEAAASFRAAVRLDPGSSATHYGLACALLASEAFTEAEPPLLRVLQLDPRHLGALVNLGTACKQQGRLEEAAAHYSRALAIQPNLAEAHNLLAQTLLEQQNFALAESHYRRALELGLHSLEVHIGLGDVAHGLGDLGEAIPHYRAATRLDPDSQYAYLRLDRALLNAGEEKQRFLQKLLEDRVYADWQEPREDSLKLAALYEYPEPAILELLRRQLEAFAPGEVHGADWWASQLGAYGEPRQGHDTVLRGVFSSVYSWSLPSAEALAAIARFAGGQPLHSYGAGTAYWERLLRDHYDLTVIGSDLMLRHRFMEIAREDYGQAEVLPDTVVFVSWIPVGVAEIHNVITRMHPGQKLVLVGEPPDAGGKARICASEDFFARLAREFRLEETVRLPAFSHLHDDVRLFVKNPGVSASAP